MDLDNYEFYNASEFTGYEDHRYSDRDFIVSELEKIPFQYRDAIMTKYSALYSETAKKSVSEARASCNTRLRMAVININCKWILESK